MSPLISVVITCYNDGALLPRAVESVRAQDFSDYEIVICDDGSTDGSSVSVARGLVGDNVSVLVHEVNRGLAAARNTAIRAASGRVIVPLDSDDLLPAGALALTARALGDGSTCDFAFGRYEELHWESDKRVMHCPPPTGQFGDAGWFPWCGCSPFKKHLWEKVGGYDESELFRKAPEDFDFWMRVRAAGGRGVLVDGVLYQYIRRSGSLGHEFTPRWREGMLTSLAKPQAAFLPRSLRMRVSNLAALGCASYWRRRAKPLAAAGVVWRGIASNPLSWALWRALAGCCLEWIVPPLRRRYTEQPEYVERIARERQAAGTSPAGGPAQS